MDLSSNRFVHRLSLILFTQAHNNDLITISYSVKSKPPFFGPIKVSLFIFGFFLFQKKIGKQFVYDVYNIRRSVDRGTSKYKLSQT